MGEENTFAGKGTTCFFCKKEDIGTDREKWHEAKLDSFKFRDAREAPELDTEKMQDEPWGKQSFTFTAEVTRNESFERLICGIKKHQSGLCHYAHKTMSKSAKKALRRCHLHMKKCMFGRVNQ